MNNKHLYVFLLYVTDYKNLEYRFVAIVSQYLKLKSKSCACLAYSQLLRRLEPTLRWGHMLASHLQSYICVKNKYAKIRTNTHFKKEIKKRVLIFGSIPIFFLICRFYRGKQIMNPHKIGGILVYALRYRYQECLSYNVNF